MHEFEARNSSFEVGGVRGSEGLEVWGWEGMGWMSRTALTNCPSLSVEERGLDGLDAMSATWPHRSFKYTLHPELYTLRTVPEPRHPILHGHRTHGHFVWNVISKAVQRRIGEERLFRLRTELYRDHLETQGRRNLQIEAPRPSRATDTCSTVTEHI
jgi:hypothetical protein